MANDLQKNVTVKVQKKSGFDKSHQNLLTTKVGTITPLLCEEVIPNETVNCKVNLSACLPKNSLTSSMVFREKESEDVEGSSEKKRQAGQAG